MGRTMTEHVLSKGDIAVATLRKPSALSDLTAKYGKDKLLVVKLDVTQLQDILDAFAKAKEVFGKIDVVYNNAGYGKDSCYSLHAITLMLICRDSCFRRDRGNASGCCPAIVRGQFLGRDKCCQGSRPVLPRGEQTERRVSAQRIVLGLPSGTTRTGFLWLCQIWYVSLIHEALQSLNFVPLNSFK